MSEFDIDTYEEFEDDVGLGQEDRKHSKGSQLEWWKGEKGRTYRVALTHFHPLEAAVIRAVKAKKADATKDELVTAIKAARTKRAEELGKSVDQLAEYDTLDYRNVRFKKLEATYKEGLGYVISRAGKGEDDKLWESLGEIKKYFTSTMLVYPTNTEGELIKSELATNWRIVPVRFSRKVYETFHQRAAGLRENNIAISGQDLLLKCTNSDFQNFDIEAAGPAVWLKSEPFKAAVLSKSHAMYPKLNPFREMSTADLKIKLGLGGGSDASESVGDEDFSGLLDQV